MVEAAAVCRALRGHGNVLRRDQQAEVGAVLAEDMPAPPAVVLPYEQVKIAAAS